MQQKAKDGNINRIWSRTYYLILGIALLGMMGGSLLGPVLPALMEPFNVTEDRVGQVLAVYTFFTALSMPFLGPLIDKLGRKWVVVPCLLLNGVAGVLAAFAPSFTVLLILRAFQGLGIAGLLPVSMTLIRDFFEGPMKVKAMGYLSSTLAIGGVLAPLIGGNLAMFDWRYSFFFYGISIPLALAILVWLPATGGQTNVSIVSAVTNYKVIIKNKGFLMLAATNFMMAFLLYAVVTFVPLHLALRMGASEGLAGIVIAIQGLAVAVVATRVKDAALRFGVTRLLIIGFVLAALALLSVPLNNSIVGVAASLLLFGCGLGMIMPLLNTMITDAVSPEYVGAATSLFNTMNFTGQSASPALLGILAALAGLNIVFIAAAIVAAGAAVGLKFLGGLLPVAFK